MKYALVLLVILAHGTLAPAWSAPDATRPNFILFITDDISPDDLGCYGNRAIQTPHLDRMAREGLVFDNACLTASSCSPSRCSIITGRYPHNTGAPELHTTLPTDQFIFPQALRQAGYYTALSGKNHIGDVARGFDLVSPGKGPGKEDDWLDILRNRPKDRPFFFWFASTDAHRDWTLNDKAPHYRPDEVRVPPFLYDGPQTRADLTGYYHEISRTDHYAGLLRAELERLGLAQTTWIIYCSDNGRPFPRSKTRLLDSGIKTPLIVWAPGRVQPARTAALVSSIDISATLLELAGVPADFRIQGVSFKPVMDNPNAVIRNYAFAEHNWHVYEAHERMVRYQSWVYIRNNRPGLPNLCVESDATFPAGRELWQMEKEGRLLPHQRDIFLTPRPHEELYKVDDDPDQTANLSDRPEHQAILNHLRTVLDEWTHQTGDSVPEQLTPTRPAGTTTNPPRGQFPGEDRNATALHHPGPVK